jgi:hypothetical protein
LKEQEAKIENVTAQSEMGEASPQMVAKISSFKTLLL